MLSEIFLNPLLLNALIAGILASIVSGIIGSYVVINRSAFVSGGIAHTVLGGIGFALWLQRVQGIEYAYPTLGALASALLAAVILGCVHLYSKEREDSTVAALWAVGMAVGILFISQTPGFNVELTGFLIGNILWVSNIDLLILACLDLIVIIVVMLLHKRFLLLSFDEDEAVLQNAPVGKLTILLRIITAISIVLLVKVVGIILVMTMLTIPAAIATRFSSRLSRVMFLAIAISSLFSLSGTVLAYQLDWPGGATIILLAGLVYSITLIGKRTPVTN